MNLLKSNLIQYFFLLTKKFHILWKFYNISSLNWNVLEKKKTFLHSLYSKLLIFYTNEILEKTLFYNIYNYTYMVSSNHVLKIEKIYHSMINKNLLKIINIYFKLFVYTLRWIIVAFVISFIYFFFSLFYIQIETTKQVAIWFILLIIFYLLMSTFNNFLNKYKYGKFTSAIQRFWKRTGMVFWLIEGFLFLIFFYYFLNSSQESLYMHDYSNLNQELLIQLKTSYKNMILLSLAIYFSFVLILNNNYLNYYQNILLLSLISLIIFFMLYVETYQFVYIVTLFTDKNWIYDDINQLWVLEFEQNNIRVKQQYFLLCLIAKYWHFIFIFISWFFFVIKCFEINKINYTLMGYNVQNLLILYILNLFCLIQWLKWLFKKFLEITYYWFHIQYDEQWFVLVSSEILTILSSFLWINSSTVSVFWTNLSNIIYQSNELNLWKYINCIYQKKFWYTLVQKLN